MERTKNRIHSICAGLLLLLLLTALLSIPASALGGSGSITVICKGKRNEQPVLLAGDEYALVQIARIQIIDGAFSYTVDQNYAESDCEWSALTASQRKQKAKELEKTALELHRFTAVAVSDPDGRVHFRDLDPGLYLLIRTKTAAENVDFTCDPGLYSIPSQDNGELIYDLSLFPKFDWTDPDKPEKLPQLGQLNWPIPILMLSGLGMLFTGFELCFSEKPENEED